MQTLLIDIGIILVIILLVLVIRQVIINSYKKEIDNINILIKKNEEEYLEKNKILFGGKENEWSKRSDSCKYSC